MIIFSGRIFGRQPDDGVHSAKSGANSEAPFEGVVGKSRLALLFFAQPVNLASFRMKIVDFGFELRQKLPGLSSELAGEKSHTERSGRLQIGFPERPELGDGGHFGIRSNKCRHLIAQRLAEKAFNLCGNIIHILGVGLKNHVSAGDKGFYF